jgi:hypothetical protein
VGLFFREVLAPGQPTGYDSVARPFLARACIACPSSANSPCPHAACASRHHRVRTVRSQSTQSASVRPAPSMQPYPHPFTPPRRCNPPRRAPNRRPTTRRAPGPPATSSPCPITRRPCHATITLPCPLSLRTA